MGQSLVKNYIHLIFSTKYRQPFIQPRKAYEQFYWQNGYGAFSIHPSQLDAVALYIANQHLHHSQATFEEEYRAFLKKYKVEYDERHVWD